MLNELEGWGSKLNNNNKQIKGSGRLNVSLPNEMIEKLNSLRGDVSLSRFVLRMIELGLKVKNKK